ncbi:3-oxoacyl-ACP reductase FabG [Euzebya sp.]|uniref:3-oxoacyl-ACP reductase FabG n=1 Tax=Euzebya sp. TaxID=1971409 RepID=UPI003512D76C
MGLLEGRVALVTGGAQGIGLAIAQRFAAEGASVVIADIDLDAATAAAEAIDGPAAGVRADVVDPDDVAAMVAATTDRFGRLDVLVNNAGITRDASLKNMTLEQFRQVIDVHLQGTWLGMKEALAVMKAQVADGRADGGAIVNMSSISGKIGNFGQSNYAAAKAGIVGMTKSVAREGAKHAIRVNAIQPGFIDTAMTRAMPADAQEAATSSIPMQRAGQPDEVAKVALFLASDLASYCTGITIEVTGGRHM